MKSVAIVSRGRSLGSIASRSAVPCRRGGRRGAAVVEFAVVAPLMFMMVFGMIELGRAIMVSEVAVHASREGARMASITSMTLADVQSWTSQYLQNSGVPQSACTISVANQTTTGGAFTTTTDLASVPVGMGIQVTVSVNFAAVTWLPRNLFSFMPADARIVKSAVMRKETT